MNINSLIKLEKAWERLNTRAEYAEKFPIKSDECQTIFREFITSVNDIDNYIMEESGFDIEETYDYKETTVQDTAITIIDRMNQIFSLW